MLYNNKKNKQIKHAMGNVLLGMFRPHAITRVDLPPPPPGDPSDYALTVSDIAVESRTISSGAKHLPP